MRAPFTCEKLTDEQAMRVVTCFIFAVYAVACATVGIANFDTPGTGIRPAHWLVLGAVISFMICSATAMLTVIDLYRVSYIHLGMSLALECIMAVTGTMAVISNPGQTVNDLVIVTLILGYFNIMCIIVYHRVMVE